MKKAEKQQSSKVGKLKTRSVEPRIFASMKYPKLVIGRLQFTDGFFVSRDPEEQRRIAERAGENAIRDITDVLVRAAPFTKETRFYLSTFEPDLIIEPVRIVFRNGVFFTADPDLLSILWKSPRLRTGEIREVTGGLLQLAAELAETSLKAAANV